MPTITRRAVVLTVWLAGLALLTVWNGLNLRLGTDLSQFLPPGASQQDRVLLSQVRGGVAARTLLLRIGGEPPTATSAPGDTEALAAASRSLAVRLRGDDSVTQVINGELTLATSAPDAVLFGYRYLIGPPDACVDALAAPALHAALEARLAELASGVAMLDRPHLAADPTACYRQLLRSLLPSQVPNRQHGVWFSPDERHALLVVVTAARASDLAVQRRVVERIRGDFAALPQSAGLRLELAGPGYFAVSSEQRIKTETVAFSLGANVIVVIILALAFRSTTLVLLGLLPLLSGVMVGTALVSWLFGSVHGITLALGSTLLGVAMDYPVHVYAHVAGTGARYARPIWRTLLLGMTTTVLGYAALAWTSLEGLSQLGILAAAGLITAALTSCYLLPQLIPTSYRLPEQRWPVALQARLPHWSPRVGAWLLLASLTGLGLVLLTQGSPWETDLRRLSTVPATEIEKDSAIRAQLGASDVARLLYAVADDEAGVLERLEAALPDLRQLEARGLLAGSDNLARWLPSPGAQQARQAALPERASLAATLAVANAGLPFRLERLAPFLDDVERARHLAPLRTADLANGPISTRAAMLLQPFDGGWLGLVPLAGVNGEAAVTALQALATRHRLQYLDLRQGTAGLLTGFFNTTLEKLPIAALAIVLALALALRDRSRLGRVLLPISIAVALTFMLLVLIHGKVNLFHLVSLILVAGLNIDYSLFLDRPSSDAAERLRTLFSVTVAAVPTFTAFGMLALSAIPALHSIGLTVAIGSFLAYALSLLLARAEPIG
jgi:predicted exporter